MKGSIITAISWQPLSFSRRMLKIAKQTTNDPYMTIIKRVTGTKGLAGTLDGFFPWGALQSVAKGSVFSLGQAACAKALHNNTSMDKQTKTVVSGGVGGAVQGLVMSPLLLLKTRVITDPTFRSSGGLVDTAVASAKVGGRIIATEGSAALFKGVGVFSAKRAADWSTRYLFVVMVEEAMRATPGAKLSDSQTIVASLAGGSLRCVLYIFGLHLYTTCTAAYVSLNPCAHIPPPQRAGHHPSGRAGCADSERGEGWQEGRYPGDVPGAGRLRECGRLLHARAGRARGSRGAHHHDDEGRDNRSVRW